MTIVKQGITFNEKRAQMRDDLWECLNDGKAFRYIDVNRYFKWLYIIKNSEIVSTDGKVIKEVSAGLSGQRVSANNAKPNALLIKNILPPYSTRSNVKGHLLIVIGTNPISCGMRRYVYKPNTDSWELMSIITQPSRKGIPLIRINMERDLEQIEEKGLSAKFEDYLALNPNHHRYMYTLSDIATIPVEEIAFLGYVMYFMLFGGPATFNLNVREISITGTFGSYSIHTEFIKVYLGINAIRASQVFNRGRSLRYISDTYKEKVFEVEEVYRASQGVSYQPKANRPILRNLSKKDAAFPIYIELVEAFNKACASLSKEDEEEFHRVVEKVKEVYQENRASAQSAQGSYEQVHRLTTTYDIGLYAMRYRFMQFLQANI